MARYFKPYISWADCSTEGVEMGNMKTWWIFGFEWWGGLRPAEMITAKGARLVPLFWGLWLRRPTKRALDASPQAVVKVESNIGSRQ